MKGSVATINHHHPPPPPTTHHRAASTTTNHSAAVEQFEQPPWYKYIDLDESLNGDNKGQIVFSKNTARLNFGCTGTKVFTGIGYVVTQAKDQIDEKSKLRPGPLEKYNPHPETGPKLSYFLDKHVIAEYFDDTLFTKYPNCKDIIICDWNKESINLIRDVLDACPNSFSSKNITVIHADITNPCTIAAMKQISENAGQPINTVYFTNIHNSFTPNLLSLYSGLSDYRVDLFCDEMFGDSARPIHAITCPKRKHNNSPANATVNENAVDPVCAFASEPEPVRADKYVPVCNTPTVKKNRSFGCTIAGGTRKSNKTRRRRRTRRRTRRRHKK